MLLDEYLSVIQEDYVSDCRKKHQALKQKDHLGYRYMVKLCIREKIGKLLKPYDDEWLEISRNYCKESEIKKRKNVKVLWDPLAIRKCFKERDKKLEKIKQKSSHLRKQFWDLRKEIMEIGKQLRERQQKRGK